MTDLDRLFADFVVVESVHIAASPDRVWALVSDVESVTRFSPECVKVEWLDGATEPRIGACFAGTSRVDVFEWTRNCTITELDEPRVFAYDVYDQPDERPQSEWRFAIRSDGDGSILEQRFAHVPDGRSTIRAMAEAGDPQATIAERAEDLQNAMRRTLDGMRDALEAT